jgi:hypothetical protein
VQGLACTIPMARMGCKVLAVDYSAILLEALRTYAQGLSKTTRRDDLLSFPRHLVSKPEIVLRMGDIPTHLPERSSVKALFAMVAEHLAARGQFVISFPDCATALEGPNRFIPVKSDESRIFTCFLDCSEDTVKVHEVLHERREVTWDRRVSTYCEVRVEPRWFKAQRERGGCAVSMGAGFSGMVRFCAAMACHGAHPDAGKQPTALRGMLGWPTPAFALPNRRRRP